MYTTRDNVRWDSVAVDHDEINEMMAEFVDADDDNRVINHQTTPCD